jgi:copper chaperone CopZ
MDMKQVMMCVSAAVLVFATAIPVFSAEQKVTLMLGGKFCEAYLGDVRDALTKVPGVKEVDFKSMKGHAVVTVESGKTTPDQLAKTVNGVKGDGWHCTAQAMK